MHERPRCGCGAEIELYRDVMGNDRCRCSANHEHDLEPLYAATMFSSGRPIFTRCDVCFAPAERIGERGAKRYYRCTRDDGHERTHRAKPAADLRLPPL